MRTYSIKDLERLSHVKAHTIRMWEKRYELLIPHRTKTNIRYYTDEHLRRLLNVSVLNGHGLKISKIAKLSDEQMHEEVRNLVTTDQGTINEVENLIVAMVELDEARFEKVINGSILRRGFEDTMVEVIQPFLQRVGVLWLVNAVKPGQEHFISNLIRQKVITAIDGLVDHQRDDGSSVLFFLPEGEEHELGLLFGHYLARKLGHRSIYLGRSVPLVDVETIVEHHLPKILVTGFLSHEDAPRMQRYLEQIQERMPKVEVLYFHRPGVSIHLDQRGCRSVGDLQELRELLR